MARDRIAHLTTASPTLTELREAATRYLGGCGTTETHNGFFCCVLPGAPTPVFAQLYRDYGHERWFEVWRVEEGEGKPFVNVITRQADEFTSAVADGFFAAAARYWELKADPDAV